MHTGETTVQINIDFDVNVQTPFTCKRKTLAVTNEIAIATDLNYLTTVQPKTKMLYSH